MKIEKAELEFIRDDHNQRWFVARDANDNLAQPGHTAETLCSFLREKGLIKPDPLEEALKALSGVYFYNETDTFADRERDVVKKIIRKLASDLTEGERDED